MEFNFILCKSCNNINIPKGKNKRDIDRQTRDDVIACKNTATLLETHKSEIWRQLTIHLFVIDYSSFI